MYSSLSSLTLSSRNGVGKRSLTFRANRPALVQRAHDGVPSKLAIFPDIAPRLGQHRSENKSDNVFMMGSSLGACIRSQRGRDDVKLIGVGDAEVKKDIYAVCR